jgi:hypothetical protein
MKFPLYGHRLKVPAFNFQRMNAQASNPLRPTYVRRQAIINYRSNPGARQNTRLEFHLVQAAWLFQKGPMLSMISLDSFNKKMEKW